MSGNRIGVSAWGRVLAVGLASVLAAGTALTGLGASVAQAAQQVYTHADGATVSYDDEAAVGERITVSGTGWLAKPDRVDEGEEGSVIGFKLIGSQGQLERSFNLENPRLGDEVANKTVWGTVWAERDGSFEIDLPWPNASNAVTDPQWEAGDSFTLQLLSGTMYSDEAGVDPSQRPDVSRTIPLTITVTGGGSGDPDPEPEPEPTPAAPVITQQPEAASAASGAQVSFTATADGEPAPTVQWQRSVALNASTVPPAFTNIAGATDPTLTVTAGTSPHVNNRWYRAVFTNSEGSATTDAVKLSIAPAPTVTTQPLGQTVEIGGTVTFSATATSAIDLTMQWQSTRTALANGEPDDQTWADVPGATADSLVVEGADADAQDGTFYRLVFANASGSTPSRAAQLRFYSKLDTNLPVTVTGTTYGPSGTTPKEFSVRAPNAVVKGQDIVIEGFDYLAVDGKTGSVSNALIDAEYSGDPRTLNTTRTVYNPQTGAVYSDKRGHNVVQAGGSDGNQGGQTIVAEDGSTQLVRYPEWAPGYFRVIVPWPDETNTTQTAGFFAENWKAGTQHTVRFLTGSLFTPNGGDYQGGISVRFTVVDEPTAEPGLAPAVTTQPAHAMVEAGEDATFTAAASGSPVPSARWESSTDGGTTWTPIADATGTTLSVADAARSQSGLQYRAVFTNATGTATTNPAVLTVTPVQDPAFTYTLAMSSGLPAGVLITPKQVEVGKPITVSGAGFFLKDRAGGSGGPIFLNQPSGGTGPVNVVGRTIENQIPGSTFSDARAHGVFQSNAGGDWTLTFPFPTPENSNLTAETAWAAGQTQTLRILTGSLVSNDAPRSVAAGFDLVAGAPAGPGIALAGGEVEQYGDLWFDLSGFTPDRAVTVALVNGAGDSIATKPFTIGADGNTANPDGQTYRKLTVPRDAVPGAYRVQVRDTASGDMLATSDPVTVVAATTRVFNPGDHDGGVEDLLVQRGGTWTFHAVGFAPNGKLTATAEVDGETVSLSGLGQLSASEKAWQLDANGDTLREPVFTRVQIPSGVEPGELAVTFGDGTRTVTRTVTVEAATSASVTVDQTAELGGTIRVTGAGFVHSNGTEGSTIAIKINDGAYSRLDSSTHANRTIWWVVEADEFGSFSIDLPIPNGTTADTGDTLGSDPALVPGDGYTLRFLTGSLKPQDQSRTLKSEPFAVTSAEPEPDPELEAGTPTIAGSAVVGARLTASPGTWGPAPVEFSYQWLADGTAIAGATGIGHTVAVADLGKQLSVRVTGSKDGYPSQSRESARTARVVAASAPVARVNPSISGTPVVGGTLTAKPGTWSVAGLSFGYQWLRNGVVIPGATRHTYQVTSTDAGKNLQVRVTASKPGVLDGTATSAAVKAGKKLTKTPTPSVSGTGKVGKTLKAKAGTWAPSKVTVTYQWLRDGVPIAKATKSSYKLVKADAGRRVSVRVTGSKSGYVSVAKTSKAKSVAKLKATVRLSVPSKVARGKQATVKVTVTGAVARPTGKVTVTVNGKKVTGVLTAAGKGTILVKLPAIGKKGNHKVKAWFTPTGDTTTSTSKSSTVSKTLKVR